MMTVDMSPGSSQLYKMFSLRPPAIIEDIEDVRVDDNVAYSVEEVLEFLKGKITKQSLLDKQPAKDDS